MGEFTDVMGIVHKNSELFSEHIRLFSKHKLEILMKLEEFPLMERHYSSQEFFTEDRWCNLQSLGKLINVLRLLQIFPSLFALVLLCVVFSVRRVSTRCVVQHFKLNTCLLHRSILVLFTRYEARYNYKLWKTMQAMHKELFRILLIILDI